ncbi:MAG: site-specific DNA-methyltransferase [Spirochaetales bacterium]|nr:site-specific DNA-methyltransferase [Spirochaetales bacterium]
MGKSPDPATGTKNDSREKLTRLDLDDGLKAKLLPYCRLKPGEVWQDKKNGHRVGVLDAAVEQDVLKLLDGSKSGLSINDPPYNVVVGNRNTHNLFKKGLEGYMAFSHKWAANVVSVLDRDASFYIWLGADQNDGFQPLPDFMIMMRQFGEMKARSFITMRNQRGYGTQKNWMAVRQELLYYVKGNPTFDINAVYTDIPKILRGYYKKVNGRVMENMERSKSGCIRAGNVWVDIQQVFYRMEENVPGAYAQKPLKAINRIVEASSREGDVVTDFFAHSGTTLISCDMLGRTCYTCDSDPLFAEMSIRRLENYRKTGKTGWQWRNPFPEILFPAHGKRD